MSNKQKTDAYQLLLEKMAFPVITLVFVILFYFSSRGLREESLLYPDIIMSLLAVILVANFILNGREWWKAVKTKEKLEVPPIWQKGYIKGVVLLVSTFAYIIIMPHLGFGVSTFVYLFSMIYYLGIRKLFNVILCVVIISCAFYGAFIMWLRIPLPEGILF